MHHAWCEDAGITPSLLPKRIETRTEKICGGAATLRSSPIGFGDPNCGKYIVLSIVSFEEMAIDMRCTALYNHVPEGVHSFGSLNARQETG